MIDTSVVTSNSTIRQSTLLTGSVIGENSRIDSCLIGRNTRIGSNVQLTDLVVDHGSVIPDGTVASNGQWPRTD